MQDGTNSNTADSSNNHENVNELQEKILELQETISTLTQERDTAKTSVEELQKKVSSLQDTNQKFFLKLTEQRETHVENNNSNNVMSVEDIVKGMLGGK